MTNFKVGDKVKFPKTRMEQKDTLFGEFATCYKTTYPYLLVSCIYSNYSVGIMNQERFEQDKNNYGVSFNPSELQKIGETMSKYDDLKQRIEALDDGWNKEADDVLMKIYESFTQRNADEDRSGYFLQIPISSQGGGLSITNYKGDEKTSFQYHSQCKKLSAFKLALLWLLDHSDIKKDENKEELQRQLDDIQRQIKEL